MFLNYDFILDVIITLSIHTKSVEKELMRWNKKKRHINSQFNLLRIGSVLKQNLVSIYKGITATFFVCVCAFGRRQVAALLHSLGFSRSFEILLHSSGIGFLKRWNLRNGYDLDRVWTKTVARAMDNDVTSLMWWGYRTLHTLLQNIAINNGKWKKHYKLFLTVLFWKMNS